MMTLRDELGTIFEDEVKCAGEPLFDDRALRIFLKDGSLFFRQTGHCSFDIHIF